MARLGAQPGDRAGEFSRVQGLIAEEVSSSAGTAGWLTGLCRTLARELPASGAGISLMTEAGTSATAAASDANYQAVEELQFTLGEGPCLEAFASGRPVLVPDLDADATGRWPVYRSDVQAHGIRAVFAFPLQMGTARLGAMDVFREQVGPLSGSALAQALTFAEVATMTLIDGQENAPDDQPAGLGVALDTSLEVYQAQGMVMVQLGVSLHEALARIRAYAYANDRALGSVARDIVGRKLSLERDEP